MDGNDEMWGHIESLFGSITHEFRSEFIGGFEERSFTAGERVLTEGTVSDTLFLVRAGELRVFLETSGETIQLSTLKPGSFFGEVSLLDPGPASAHVEGVLDGSLLGISNQHLLNLYETSPKNIAPLMRNLATHLAHNLRRSSQGTVKLKDGAWMLKDIEKQSGGLLDWLSGLLFGTGGNHDAQR